MINYNYDYDYDFICCQRHIWITFSVVACVSFKGTFCIIHNSIETATHISTKPACKIDVVQQLFLFNFFGGDFQYQEHRVFLTKACHFCQLILFGSRQETHVFHLLFVKCLIFENNSLQTICMFSYFISNFQILLVTFKRTFIYSITQLLQTNNTESHQLTAQNCTKPYIITLGNKSYLAFLNIIFLTYY